jgi:hypothetical protein
LTEPLFQTAQLVADRRLAQAQKFGGLRCAASPFDGLDQPQIACF